MDYYVNKNTHEVHQSDCSWLPAPENREYLGSHSSCKEAVKKAQKDYENADGCKHCSEECNTK
ncbi:hypothetical protein [Chitinophaga sancti]|uniref:Uncharacterized protein n=1 Tax=Chitinophaga sancti TaxID=1004 RepID=A0A1K1PN22_9BACT|nr:hypothetical protein [Chitinophaga sancti]WQG88378.1 hypothetical protein SR876_26000 [Chitinophaga sancti]SFW48142.1 hypothetical protein SAMN05661012_02065 [Chitinophaga sancti]